MRYFHERFHDAEPHEQRRGFEPECNAQSQNLRGMADSVSEEPFCTVPRLPIVDA